jgi:hypothetical protein
VAFVVEVRRGGVETDVEDERPGGLLFLMYLVGVLERCRWGPDLIPVRCCSAACICIAPAFSFLHFQISNGCFNRCSRFSSGLQERKKERGRSPKRRSAREETLKEREAAEHAALLPYAAHGDRFNSSSWFIEWPMRLNSRLIYPLTITLVRGKRRA